MADDPKKSYYNVKRSRDEFAFEEIDNDFPYKIKKDYGISSKKIVVFNYSSMYFRRKVAQGPLGVYFIIGGNIPKDMQDTQTFDPTPIGIVENPVPPLVCTLNKGSADRIKSFKVYNLSPNDLTPLPCGCIINPEWTENNCDANLKDAEYLKKYGGACVKVIINPDGSQSTIGIVKSIPSPCQQPEVFFEAAGGQKPNTLYFPSYQHSNSRHPRAEGYAHEDNYNCLKYYKNGPGQGVCCDSMGSLFDNKPGVKSALIKQKPDGSYYFDTSIGGVDFGFYCLPIIPGEKGPLSRDNPRYWCDGTKNCDTGFIMANIPGITTFTKPVKKGNVNAQTICEDYEYKDDDGNRVKCIVSENRFIRKFHVSGNEDCGCTGQGGAIYISGYTDTSWCQMECRSFKPGCGARGCFSSYDVVESEATVTYPDPISMCDGRYLTKKHSNLGEHYLWMGYIWPTTGFADWKNIEMDRTGGLRSVGCGNEIIYECNDIP